MEFKNWFDIEESYWGYVLSGLGESLCILTEAKKNKKKKSHIQSDLFDKSSDSKYIPSPEERDPGGEVWRPPFDPEEAEKFAPYQPPFKELHRSCPITPLSGYSKHIKKIQQFAMSSPENFAQTMMFSPLSANVPFPKHWDGFNTMMAILHSYFPNKINPEQIKEIVNVFDDKYHSLAHTISSWKLETIADIWSNKEKYFSELPQLASTGDDRKLIARLSQIPGVQPVKAGFMAQLLFGRAGCLDTHNIDIYTHVFPDMINDLDPKKWNIKGDKVSAIEKGMPKEVNRYVKALEKLSGKGIGTGQLWDIWVDFVESFYKYMSQHGLGVYFPMGSSIDKKNPLYQWLAQQGPIKKSPSAGSKTKSGIVTGDFDVPLAYGGGMGASATHLQLTPEEMYKQLYRIYRLGKPGGEAATSVPFYRIKNPKKGFEPLDKKIGMGMEPSMLHYFGRDDEFDTDYINHVIKQRLAQGGRKGLEKTKKEKEEEERMSRLLGRA